MSTKDITSFYDKVLEILTSNKYDFNFWILQMEFCETAIKFNAISKTTCARKGQKFLADVIYCDFDCQAEHWSVMKTIGL